MPTFTKPQTSNMLKLFAVLAPYTAFVVYLTYLAVR